MYKPKIEDVSFTGFRPLEENLNKLEAFAVMLLNEGGKKRRLVRNPINPFAGYGKCLGYKISAIVATSSTQDERIATLVSAAQKLVDDFDIKRSAINQDFDGDIESLWPTKLSETLTLEEIKDV